MNRTAVGIQDFFASNAVQPVIPDSFLRDIFVLQTTDSENSNFVSRLLRLVKEQGAITRLRLPANRTALLDFLPDLISKVSKYPDIVATAN